MGHRQGGLVELADTVLERLEVSVEPRQRRSNLVGEVATHPPADGLDADETVCELLDRLGERVDFSPMLVTAQPQHQPGVGDPMPTAGAGGGAACRNSGRSALDRLADLAIEDGRAASVPG